MPSVEFTAEAVADIKSITEYTIKVWGAAQATKYVDGLAQLCAELAAMPTIGKDASWLAPNLRSYPYQSHVIYYRSTPMGMIVVAVIHKRQDVERKLKG